MEQQEECRDAKRTKKLQACHYWGGNRSKRPFWLNKNVWVSQVKRLAAILKAKRPGYLCTIHSVKGPGKRQPSIQIDSSEKNVCSNPSSLNHFALQERAPGRIKIRAEESASETARK